MEQSPKTFEWTLGPKTYKDDLDMDKSKTNFKVFDLSQLFTRRYWRNKQIFGVDATERQK